MSSEIEAFDVCVLCALPVEAKAFRNIVSQHCSVVFTEDFSKDNIAYFSTAIHNNRGESLKILLSWLPRYGPLETGWHLQSLLREFHPRFVAMTGICAGDERKVKLGDLVIAERAFMMDSGKIVDKNGRKSQEYDTYTASSARDLLQFARMFDLRDDITNTLRPPIGELLPPSPSYHIAPMASSNAVRADKPFDVVRVPVRGAVALDMEGAAFYQTVENFPGIRSLLVKGVSDYADGNKNDTYQVYASELSALYMLSFIKAYVRSDLMPRLYKDATPTQAREGKSATVPFSVPTQAAVENIAVPLSGPLKIFISCDPEDSGARIKLEKHLAMLKRSGQITWQYSRNVHGGLPVGEENKRFLSESQIILLLISSNYTASDVYDSEVTQACALFKSGLARVIPVLLSPTAGWEEDFFGKLQPLPTSKKPISLWSSQDQAFYEVAQGIKAVVDQLSKKS